MATDLEQLVVRLVGDIKNYEAQLRRAQNITNRQARSIESRFAQMGSKIGSSAAVLGRRLAAGLAAGLTIGAFTKFSDAATRIDNALKIAGLSGENLEKVYERLRSSAIKNAAPIEALVELYGRAALVQKELGITGEELLGFTDKIAVALRVSGKSAAESSGALLQLSQALGSGVVRAEEFNSILEGALPIAQAAAAGLKEAGGSVARLRQLVVDGKVSSEAFFRAFEAGSVILEQKVAGAQLTVGQAFGNLQTSLTDAVREFNNATGASEKMATGINNLATAISDLDVSTFIKRIAAARSEVEKFLNSVGNSSFMERFAEFVTGTELTIGKPISIETIEAEKKLSGLQYQIEIVQQLIEHNKEMSIDTSGAEAELADLLRQAQAVQATISGGSRGYVPGTPGDPNALAQKPTLGAAKVKPVSLSQFTLPGDDKAKKARESDYAREIRQIQERTAALQAETAVMAGLNPLVNDYGFALEKARAQQELLAAAEKEKIAITPALRAQIDQLSTAYANTVVQAERLAESQELARERAQEFIDIGRSAIGGLIDDLRNGTSAADAFKNALDRVLDNLIQIGLNSVFGGGSTGGLGLIGSLFGFAKGGYTGNGGKYTPAGVVHRGEYVLNQQATRRIGVGNLDAMNRGYANGGLVGAAPRIPSMSFGGGGKPQEIVLHLVGEEGELFTPRVTQISGQTAGVVVRESRPQLSRDAVNSVQQASRNRPGIFR